MPYIAVQAYPKDEATKQKVAEEINQVFLKYWGCAPEAISISFESVDPSVWEEAVVEAQIRPNADKMLIMDGKKQY
ncbi:hypothetical protein IJT17_09230 [bacterium]|nr:hypothetical protein [bacterium]